MATKKTTTKQVKKTTKTSKTTQKAQTPTAAPDDLQPVPLMLINSKDEYTIGH